MYSIVVEGTGCLWDRRLRVLLRRQELIVGLKQSTLDGTVCLQCVDPREIMHHTQFLRHQLHRLAPRASHFIIVRAAVSSERVVSGSGHANPTDIIRQHHQIGVVCSEYGITLHASLAHSLRQHLGYRNAALHPPPYIALPSHRGQGIMFSALESTQCTADTAAHA